MRLIDADALMEYCNNLRDKTIDANDIARFPTAVGWISVMESLPEPGVNVLVYMERDAWPDSGYCRKRDIEKGWQINGRWHCDGCSRVEGLYWMPLPEPPEVSE